MIRKQRDTSKKLLSTYIKNKSTFKSQEFQFPSIKENFSLSSMNQEIWEMVPKRAAGFDNSSQTTTYGNLKKNKLLLEHILMERIND